MDDIQELNRVSLPICTDANSPLPEDVRTLASGNHLVPESGMPIWTKEELDGPQGARLPEWPRNSLAAFRGAISNRLSEPFPCMFATAAEHKGQLVYAFINSVDADDDIDHVGHAIKVYLASLSTLSPEKVDFQVLVVLVKPRGGDPSLSDYAADAQALLAGLHHRDAAPWPQDLPTDEDDPRWSYAYDGRALFVNISTPANQVRQSRNVGPSLAFIISPRDVFDRIAGPTEKGRKVRANIRQRTELFDGGLPSAPWGAVAYGEGAVGMERKQYILPDDNDHPIDLTLKKCPFHGAA